MSGGSMDYLYSRVEDAANIIGGTPERKAFARHLYRVAEALHDIEWVDSCDYGPGDENAAIMACVSGSDVLESAIESARYARDELDRALSLCDSTEPTGVKA